MDGACGNFHPFKMNRSGTAVLYPFSFCVEVYGQRIEWMMHLFKRIRSFSLHMLRRMFVSGFAFILNGTDELSVDWALSVWALAMRCNGPRTCILCWHVNPSWYTCSLMTSLAAVYILTSNWFLRVQSLWLDGALACTFIQRAVPREITHLCLHAPYQDLGVFIGLVIWSVFCFVIVWGLDLDISCMESRLGLYLAISVMFVTLYMAGH